MKKVAKKPSFFLVLGILCYFLTLFFIVKDLPKRVISVKADCEVQLYGITQTGQELILKEQSRENGTSFFVLANGVQFSKLRFESTEDLSPGVKEIEVQLLYKAQPLMAAHFQGNVQQDCPRFFVDEVNKKMSGARPN